MFEALREVHHDQQLLTGNTVVNFCFRQVSAGIGHDPFLSVDLLRQNTADSQIRRVSVQNVTEQIFARQGKLRRDMVCRKATYAERLVI